MQNITISEKQTISLGKKIARQIKSGTVLGLVGDLGAGKTQFTKGLAQGFNIKNHITSPTFVLLKSYKISANKNNLTNLIHLDCYRLSSPEELLDLGWQEIINNPNNIIVVEWADRVKSIMPKNTQWLNFKLGKTTNQRLINFK